MTTPRSRSRRNRHGTIVVLVGVLLILFVTMVSFALDYGYILSMQTDLQRAADAAALAAVQDLLPADDGTQDLEQVQDTLRSYAETNLNPNFRIAEDDIEIGRFDTAQIYSNVVLLDSGIFDTVRVTVRRDGTVNPRFPLFFARALGVQDAAATATAAAVLQKPIRLVAGSGVLPFSVPVNEWDKLHVDDVWSIYGDGKIEDQNGRTIPGNWGTLDIGSGSNSTSDLGDQIVQGLRQSDLDALYDDGRISENTHIDTRDTMWLNGDPGLSSGMKAAVQAIHGQRRIVPLYDQNNGSGGNNLEFRVVRWGIVQVVNSRFSGSKTTYVNVKKSFLYDGLLVPVTDLSVDSAIDGAFTRPVLVE